MANEHRVNSRKTCKSKKSHCFGEQGFNEEMKYKVGFAGICLWDGKDGHAAVLMASLVRG